MKINPIQPVCLSVAMAVAVATGSAFAGEVVYSNDFSTRTMAGDDSKWVTVHYTAGGELFRNYYANEVNTDGTVWQSKTGGSRGHCQDGWVKCTRTYAQRNNNLGRFTVSTDANPCGVFSSTMTGSAGRLSAHHPTRNSITSGVIRATADLRVPLTCTVDLRGSVRMRIETAQLMDDSKVCDNLLNYFLFEAGLTFVVTTNAGEVVISGRGFILGGDGNGTESGAIVNVGIGAGHWVRVVTESDLDGGTTFTYKCYDLGTAAPTFDTTGTLIGELTHTFKRTYNPAAMGGIEGFAFRTFTPNTVALYGESGYNDDAAYKVDNLKMEWKASGAADFKTIYLNDFSTSRRRTLSPARSATCVYAAASADETDAYSYPASCVREYKDYTDGNDTSLVPKKAGSAVSPQPLGVDGWRRCNTTTAQVFVTTNSGQRVVAFAEPAGPGKWAQVVHPLAETITSGVVKVEVDMRVPARLGAMSGQTGDTFMSLVPIEMWDECRNNQGEYAYFRAGIRKKATADSGDDVYALFSNNSGLTWGGEKLVNGNWYRVTETLRLDDNKHDFAIYPIGATPVALGTELEGVEAAYSIADRGFPSKTSGAMSGKTLKQAGIGAVLLGTYATTNKIESMPLMTNIRVWRDVGTENERLIYSNDFGTRTRIEDGVKATVLASARRDRMFEGLDFWQRNNSGTGSFWLTAGDNPCVAMHTPTSYAYYAQSIGGSYRKGGATIQADFCPPLAWVGSSGFARVMFGNDELLVGSLVNGNGYFGDNHQFYFNMQPSGSKTTADTWVETKFKVAGATTSAETVLKTNHWYRCVGRLDFAAQKGDFSLYDMGTAHPAPDAANGALLATMPGIQFNAATRFDSSPEISSVSLGGYLLMSYMRWRGDRCASACFDNIKVTYDPPGFIIVVR